MIIVKRVLVPTDFSAPSVAALKYGVEFARTFGARLHLLHVSESPVVDAAGDARRQSLAEVEAEPDYLGPLLSERDKRELRPVFHTRLGSASEEIIRYADERDIDLIVMGTHGREGFERLLLGSVAETVVRRASCPVLTVHSLEPELMAEEARANGCTYASS